MTTVEDLSCAIILSPRFLLRSSLYITLGFVIVHGDGDNDECIVIKFYCKYLNRIDIFTSYNCIYIRLCKYKQYSDNKPCLAVVSRFSITGVDSPEIWFIRNNGTKYSLTMPMLYVA